MFALRRLLKEYKGEKVDPSPSWEELPQNELQARLPISLSLLFPALFLLALSSLTGSRRLVPLQGFPHLRCRLRVAYVHGGAGVMGSVRCGDGGAGMAPRQLRRHCCLFFSPPPGPIFFTHTHAPRAVYAEVSRNAPHGITAGPVDDDNFFEWEAVIA